MNGRRLDGTNGSGRKPATAPKRRNRNEATKAQVGARKRFLREHPPSPEGVEEARRELEAVERELRR
jgi:hypothetical protein